MKQLKISFYSKFTPLLWIAFHPQPCWRRTAVWSPRPLGSPPCLRGLCKIFSDVWFLFWTISGKRISRTPTYPIRTVRNYENVKISGSYVKARPDKIIGIRLIRANCIFSGNIKITMWAHIYCPIAIIDRWTIKWWIYGFAGNENE